MSIYTRQNEEGLLGFLKLQRILYSKAKRFQYVYDIFAILVSIVFLILPTFIESVSLWNISIFMAFFVFLFGCAINIYVSNLKDVAAGIQQRFDIYVLGVPISYIGLKVPDSGMVAKLGIKYKNRKVENLKNWYSDYSGFEEERQVLFCQKENINWDRSLRFKLFWFVLAFFVFSITVIIILGIASDDLHLAFCLFSWLLPYLSFGYKTISTLYKDIKRLEILGSELINIESISIELISDKISQVQRLIWEHRKYCFLIPDFFYKINKREQQEIEDLLAKESRENLKKLKGNDNSKK